MTGVTTDTSPASLLELWVDRIGAEYREDPGLSLTPAQAARFWNLTPEFCRSVIDYLTAGGRLRMTTTGCLVATGDRMKTVFTMGEAKEQQPSWSGARSKTGPQSTREIWRATKS